MKNFYILIKPSSGRTKYFAWPKYLDEKAPSILLDLSPAHNVGPDTKLRLITDLICATGLFIYKFPMAFIGGSQPRASGPLYKCIERLKRETSLFCPFSQDVFGIKISCSARKGHSKFLCNIKVESCNECCPHRTDSN